MTDEEIRVIQEENAAMKAKLAETGDTEELRKQFDAAERERKELIAARDKAKEKARQEEADRLAAQGEYKTLAEQKAAELDAASKRLEELGGKVEKYRQRDEEELKGLVEKVPEHLREDVSDETLPLETRLRLARKLSAQKQPGPGYRPPGETGNETLQDKYNQAVKAGNVAEQMSLKRQIYEQQQTRS